MNISDSRGSPARRQPGACPVTTESFPSGTQSGKLAPGPEAQELSEMMAQVTLYSGFPSGANGSRVLAEVLQERGIPLPN